MAQDANKNLKILFADLLYTFPELTEFLSKSNIILGPKPVSVPDVLF